MTATDHARSTDREHLSDGGKLLRTAMGENALFSSLSGLVMAVGAAALDDRIGVDSWLLVALGVGLVVYALELFWFTRSPGRLRLGGRLAVAADIGWVVGAAVLIGATDILTAEGEVALAAVSVIVAGLAAAQWIGLLRLSEGKD